MLDKSTRFQKGDVPWNKGLLGYREGYKHSEATKKKIRETRLARGIKLPPRPKGPRITVICLICDAAFDLVPSRAKLAKYCSSICKAKSQKGSVPANKGVFKSNSYGSLHRKVRVLRGTPSFCEICGTTSARRFEWANLTGNYADINDYKRMCTSCHNIFDGKINNIVKGKFTEITGIEEPKQ